MSTAVLTCKECSAELSGRRSDAEFCCDAHRKRYARRGPASADSDPNPEAPIEKLYLLADAPQQSGFTSEGRPLPKAGRTIIVLSIAAVSDAAPGSYETTLTAQEIGTAVEFVNGKFSTADPEIQQHLDARGGWCSEEQWEAAWLSQAERDQRRRDGLRNLEQEIIALRLRVAAGKGGTV